MLYEIILVVFAVCVAAYALKSTVVWALLSYAQWRIGRGLTSWWVTAYPTFHDLVTLAWKVCMAGAPRALVEELMTTHMLVRGATAEMILQLRENVRAVDTGDYQFEDCKYHL